MGSLLSIRNLNVVFDTFDGTSRVLRNINLDVGKNEALGIVGETGSGKSVLCQAVMGVLPIPGRVESGSIVFKGKDLLKLNAKEKEDMRGGSISMILQSPMTSLNPLFRVKTQMVEVIRTHTALDKKQSTERAKRLLELVRIPDPANVLERYPFELSGGMSQRVMIAMAVSCNPSMIIADEPTTALDVTVEKQIIELMKEVMSELSSSLIWISHDLDVVKQVCDRIAVMYGGVFIEIGETEKILSNPLHPYSKALMAARPSVIKRGKPLQSIDGFVPNMLEVPEGCIFASRCKERSESCSEGMPPKLIEIEEGRYIACCKYTGSNNTK